MRTRAVLKTILVILCLQFAFFKLSAQPKINCDSLLQKEVIADPPKQIIENIKQIDCFGLDSIDLKFFGNGPVIGSLLLRMVSKDTVRKITYSELLSQINRMKADTGYSAMRKQVIAMNALEAMKANPDTWENGKKLLKEIETSDDEIEKLHNFMLQNAAKNWNYRELVVYYDIKKDNDEKKSNPKE
jgi:hypothetical protein